MYAESFLRRCPLVSIIFAALLVWIRRGSVVTAQHTDGLLAHSRHLPKAEPRGFFSTFNRQQDCSRCKNALVRAATPESNSIQAVSLCPSLCSVPLVNSCITILYLSDIWHALICIKWAVDITRSLQNSSSCTVATLLNLSLNSPVTLMVIFWSIGKILACWLVTSLTKGNMI